MGHQEIPSTQGVRFLREKKITFTPHFYRYEEHGGTAHAARELGVPEHAVIKTLVLETEGKEPFLVLMHGDREVSTKQVARFLSVKHVSPCDVSAAERHTGYRVGGISPFGARNRLALLAERSIFLLPKMYINGGKRGFLVEISPDDLRRALSVTEIEAGFVPEKKPAAGGR